MEIWVLFKFHVLLFMLPVIPIMLQNLTLAVWFCFGDQMFDVYGSAVLQFAVLQFCDS